MMGKVRVVLLSDFIFCRNYGVNIVLEFGLGGLFLIWRLGNFFFENGV